MMSGLIEPERAVRDLERRQQAPELRAVASLSVQA